MNSLKNQTAHLRRTYRYPADDDSDTSQPDAMDEQGTNSISHFFSPA